ncbi:MAG: dipeptide ABC transporter ATP-binding protein [Paracoccaceae bacterium]
MSGPGLSVSDLDVGVVGGPRVVDGLSFDVRPGRTLCLVGESGSGKSVTALAVMGLLPPGVLRVTGGAIRLGGEDLTAATPARMRALRASALSMIFQEPMTALNPVLPVGRQIAEVLEAHGELDAAARRARVVEIMDEVHLPEPERLQNAFPHQLSGGQRQRVMIAMALVLRPALLIADEPTTALDVTTQRQILALIRELRESRGTAVLFITHDMGVVSEIADEVAVLRHGVLQEAQPVRSLLSSPRTDYARALLQAVPSLAPRPPREDHGAPVVLETRGLSKTYREAGFLSRGREVRAAQDVDLTLRGGRTLGIVGESGSGKSTVARCIVRLIDPTAGSIKVAGEEIATLSRRALKPHRRRFQIVFQDPFRSLNPRLRVVDSITEGPTNFGVPREQARERARELMDLVHLPPSALERYPHQFSGGQRQRIAVARALAMEPDLLIADEAVSALDVSVQAQVLRLLDEVQARLGVAILFITHDLRVAAQICDEVMVMQRGVVVEHGPAADVLGQPLHDYTRALIEAAPGRHWDFARMRPLAPEREPAPA